MTSLVQARGFGIVAGICPATTHREELVNSQGGGPWGTMGSPTLEIRAVGDGSVHQVPGDREGERVAVLRAPETDPGVTA
jgi:hypothetical protein